MIQKGQNIKMFRQDAPNPPINNYSSPLHGLECGPDMKSDGVGTSMQPHWGQTQFLNFHLIMICKSFPDICRNKFHPVEQNQSKRISMVFQERDSTKRRKDNLGVCWVSAVSIAKGSPFLTRREA